MRLITETKQYVACPECGENTGSTFDAEHHSRGFGPWWCDECGAGYMGRPDGARGIKLELTGERHIDTTVLLEIPPQSRSIYLATKGMRFMGLGEEDDEGGQHYFYEEHTCPTNWLRDVFRISINGDSDPHGLAKYVDRVDGAPDWEDRDAKFDEVMKKSGLKIDR